MALSAQDKQEMAQLIAATLAAQAAPTVDASQVEKPAKAKAARAKDTDAKIRAAGLVRKMDPINVAAGELVFRVMAESAEGTPYSGGARVVMFDERGKIARSLTRSMLDAMSEPSLMEQLQAAVDTVDKRAMLGAHKPTAEQREAAKAAAQS